MMPINDNTTMMSWTVWCSATAGKNGSANRRNPYVPIFSRMPARITDPAVGASTCASGSQVCSGKSGTLMAKARKNAPNSHHAMLPSVAT